MTICSVVYTRALRSVIYAGCLWLWQTLEFELRKLEAQQALQQVDLLKTFMPNSFLVSGGELHVLTGHTHIQSHSVWLSNIVSTLCR